jgi:Cu(I)/Ag(I) efflux system membrane protein CusA/SilA
MIDSAIEFSARNAVLVLALTGAAVFAGWYSLRHTPLDALPDLSDKQVIVYSHWDRAPDQVDLQVTFPIVSALLGAPGVRSVRGQSDFGSSFVYVIFDDDVDLYWARSRTLEYLSPVLSRLPEGVRTELGPDATGTDWIFQYVLIDRSGKQTLADLRSLQDWYLAYYLRSVPGVVEVASAGGFVRQYQVNVNPNRLRAFGIPIQRIAEALRNGNRDAGGRVVESAGAEFIVRGLGYANSTSDLEQILVGSAHDGRPVRIGDIATVGIASDMRRGLIDFDGTGDTVSGVVVMRQGQNALEVIDRVKAKISQIQSSLPDGVQIIPIYDRSELIHRSIDSLKMTILEVMVTVSIVIVLFLWHVPSVGVPLITIPVAVLLAFIPFRLLGISSNIMSLAGIALAIGALVDAAIVVVEQTHKRLDEWNRAGRKDDPRGVIVAAVKQVARPSFFALLVMSVSFLPILTLEAEEGRLFKPLAYTKSFTLLLAAILTITLDPALRLMCARHHRFQFRPAWLCKPANALLVGRVHSEDRNPINRQIIRFYEPIVGWSLRNAWIVVTLPLVLMAGTVLAWHSLGSEFMPPLDEGALLYMPTTMPGISVSEAQRLLRATDRILKEFPETDHVLGKAGRASTATDPAPLSMLETIITLHPPDQWRRVPTWYSSWAPEILKPLLRRFTPDHISKEELVDRMNQAVKLPGVSNSWSMPIRGRIDMLTTGIRTPLGAKVSGPDLQVVERICVQLESALSSVKGTRNVFAERNVGGYFVNLRWNRAALAGYGLTIEEAQAAVQYGIGGENVSELLDGRERYPINIRYLRDYRDNLDALSEVVISSSDGRRAVPLGNLAEIEKTQGATMVRNEDGMRTGYVYIDAGDRDVQTYVDEAAALVHQKLDLPAGYTLSWSGQYEALSRMKRRLTLVVPLTLVIILILIYANLRSVPKTLMVVLAVPFSAIGAIWCLYLLGYHLSLAVWVGLIALLGVDAETGVFMLIYLDHAYERAVRDRSIRSLADLRLVVLEGAARRVRPKFMTVSTIFVGLLPLLWSTGTGADVMKRIAAPMVGGILTSFPLELLVYPAVYYAWLQHSVSGHPGRYRPKDPAKLGLPRPGPRRPGPTT